MTADAGLDAAIVNPAHVYPFPEIPDGERRLAGDLVFNRVPDALQRFIAHFSSGPGGRAERAAGAVAERDLRVDVALAALAAPLNEDVAVRHALAATVAKVRRYGSFRYGAKGWRRERRIIARIEASDQGTDTRFVVTNLADKPKWLYERVYCARGQMENLIKLHKAQLASDRMSCHSATANQVRLALHTAAFWLMHAVRAASYKQPVAALEGPWSEEDDEED